MNFNNVQLQPLVLPAIPAPAANPQQPNWNNLGNGLNAIAAEAPHLANFNPMAQFNALNQNMGIMTANLNANFALVGGAINQMGGAINQMMGMLVHMQQTLDLQPMRLHNHTASSDAPLVYPLGIVGGNPLPATPAAARNMTGAQYTAAIAALAPGLAPVPANAAVALKKAHFLSYIGCPA